MYMPRRPSCRAAETNWVVSEMCLVEVATVCCQLGRAIRDLCRALTLHADLDEIQRVQDERRHNAARHPSHHMPVVRHGTWANVSARRNC